jgi:hypothetical protein
MQGGFGRGEGVRDWLANADGRVVCLGMDRGEDYIEGILEALRRHGVRSGVMLSTVATFERVRLHQSQGLEDVNDQRVRTIQGPVEVTGVSGIIADGEPHLHATVADRDGHAYGGHLEPGCPVLYLAEVAVLALDAPGMTRRPGPDGRGLRG